MPEHGFSRITHPRIPEGLTAWGSHDGVLVFSSLADMQLPGAPEGTAGPTWLVSVSRGGGRATDDDMLRVVAAFAMPAWEEDNHYPGISRGMFCPVDPQYRVDCECKITETTIVEDDGFTWTTPTDGPCRGCDLDRMRRGAGLTPMPCPIHAEASA